MSIADKLVTVYDNQQKVYDAGKKAIIEQVCPEIHETATVVACYPLEGYPLTVTTEAEATGITRCGKNLLNMNRENLRIMSWTKSDGTPSPTYYGVELLLPPGSYVLKATPNTDVGNYYIYGTICDLDGKYIGGWNAVVGKQAVAAKQTLDNWRRFFIYEAQYRGDNTDINGTAMQNHVAGIYAKFDIQIEVGSTATAFEPYCGETFAPGDTILGKPGVNTIWADTGEVTVTGRADPSAIIENLTTAIVSYGGNV